MGLIWLLAVVACAASVSSEHGGASLRSALEALQRRQRGRVHGPLLPPPDYDAVYEFVPPQGYPAEADYGVDVEDLEDEPSPKYYVKVLDDDNQPPDAYKYKIIKKKNSISKGESAFRERTHHSDNEKLRELFMERNDKNQIDDAADSDNDREYALFLGQLWSKYKLNKEHDNANSVPQGVVKLYKEKIVKKRYPDTWGPVAFKRKRSSDSQSDQPILIDYEGRKDGPVTQDPNYNTYEVSDDDKDDLREEYAIAFQPLDDESSPNIDDNQFTYDNIEKRFPVTKRSSDFYQINSHRKRFAQNQNKRETSKAFRSSSGTDPKIIQDLSKIFGESDIEIIKAPVKRSNTQENHNHEHDHEVKPPMITNHNHTYEHNTTHVFEDDSHEHHGHNIHHPGVSSKEHEHSHGEMETHSHSNNEKPITVRKKSIDWSDYFGIDKRNKQSVSFVNDLSKDRLKNQYFDTFNEEVVYPLNSFRRHSFEKRNYVESKSSEETKTHKDAHNPNRSNNRNAELSEETNKDLDGIDDRLKKMEGVMVDEALQYTNGPVQLDTKKEQEMKEQILSRLAAAYSLEKMRKALKEFKQSLQIQKAMAQSIVSTQPPVDEAKSKRVAVKKEKVEILSNDIPMSGKDHEENNDFEDEQGAGHFLNGNIEEGFSEGYMGGSGRHRTPVMSTVGASGACPILAKIVQRCRGVDLLAGDRGQLFLPLCSLHQICYLCGEAPPTTCDLVFLSEADTTCEGDMGCQRAARSALMALRELHDNLADELDGECEANPCLPATLRLNLGWQRAFQR